MAKKKKTENKEKTAKKEKVPQELDKPKEKILLKDLEEEVKDSYISYSMSVIMGRALPDVRDGLKPVQRRILYTMHGLNLRYNQPYKKCARITGECLGKYHPHGDMAVYDALVRMAQDFSLRHPLIDGQGNFGSIDGDPPAAMRYSEARLQRISNYILSDIEKDTVDFVPNFDNSLEEPLVLPAILPNLLINGTAGIAVGMATSMPPHNLAEVVDATTHYIDNPNCTVKDLLKFVKGPDFPTGGIVLGKEDLQNAYKTGKGRVIIRGRVDFGEHKGKTQIIIKEIPYQVNKSTLIENIANLVQKKTMEGISDIRDESDKEGVRIVIELKRDIEPQIVLNRIYKHTQLETTFSIINLAIVEGRPRLLNLKQIIAHYVSFRKSVIIRRTRFELEKAQRRAHILEGLKKALKFIDKVISIIKKSPNPQEAKSRLMKELDLTEVQAQAILEMQLQRLTNLEQKKIDSEYLELIKKIEYLKGILSSERKVEQIIKEEIGKVKEEFQDKRRTQIEAEREELDIEDLIHEEDVVITVTHNGYIKRQGLAAYREQKRGGRGITSMQTKEEDFVQHLFVASSKDYLLFFTDKGKIYWLKVYNIPAGSRTSVGRNIINLLHLSAQERITQVLSLRNITPQMYLVLSTKKGIIKKVDISKLGKPTKKGLITISLDKDDLLVGAGICKNKDEIFLATRKGMSIRFAHKQIRSMGRQARGVRGISLSKGDEVVAMQIADKDQQADTEMLTIAEKGFGKRTPIKEYRIQSRAGKGIKNMRVSPKTGEVMTVLAVSSEDQIMCVTQKGILIRLGVADIRESSRATQGVKIIKIQEDDGVGSAARIIAE